MSPAGFPIVGYRLAMVIDEIPEGLVPGTYRWQLNKIRIPMCLRGLGAAADNENTATGVSKCASKDQRASDVPGA